MAQQFPTMELVGADLPSGSLFDALKYLKLMQRHPLFTQGVDIMISLRYHRSMGHDLLVSAIPSEITVGAPSSPWSNFRGGLTTSLLRFDKTAAFVDEFECKELAWHASVLSCAFDTVVKPGEILAHIALAPPARNVEPKLIITPFSGERIKEIERVQLRGILHLVQRQYNLDIVIVSGAADRLRLAELAANLREDGLLNISTICTNTLVELVQTLADATVVLTADSSPAHLATALNKPTVALIGGGHPGWFGHWQHSAKQVWLENRVPCYGCNWKCIYDKPICLTEISAKLVADEIIKRVSVVGCMTELRNIH